MLRQPYPVRPLWADPAAEDLGGDPPAAELFAHRAHVYVHPTVLPGAEGSDGGRVHTDDGEWFHRCPFMVVGLGVNGQLRMGDEPPADRTQSCAARGAQLVAVGKRVQGYRNRSRFSPKLNLRYSQSVLAIHQQMSAAERLL